MNRFFATAAAIALSAAGMNAQTDMTDIKPVHEGDPVVELKTTMGDILVELYNDTPLHRDNFIKLVGQGHYDGVLFHRVIDQFMVQTGDPDSREAAPGRELGSGDTGYTIAAEIEYPRHYHKYGALAAARTGDEVNPERRSSGSQFYIVTGKKYSERQAEAMQMRRIQKELEENFHRLAVENRDTIQAMQRADDREGLEKFRLQLIDQAEKAVGNIQPVPEITEAYARDGGTPHLDGAYTVFGEVISGMDVVEKIQKVETDRRDRPVQDVRLISARLLEN